MLAVCKRLCVKASLCKGFLCVKASVCRVESSIRSDISSVLYEMQHLVALSNFQSPQPPNPKLAYRAYVECLRCCSDERCCWHLRCRSNFANRAQKGWCIAAELSFGMSEAHVRCHYNIIYLYHNVIKQYNFET